MKRIVLLILTGIICYNSFSQCVSIELSIQWEKGENVFPDKCDTICIPYLKIIYRNNINYPLYFLKVSGSRMGLPKLTKGLTIKDDLNLYERAVNHLDYSNNKYNVKIGGFPYYSQGWSVINDTVTSEEIVTDVINDDLVDIYRYIYQKINSTSQNIISYKSYKASDINENGILTTLKDQFVFLKAGEIYEDKYNLIGFKMVKGSFNFTVNLEKMFDFVYTESTWDEKQMKWVYPYADLPDKVKDYSLYKGAIFSNSIGVDFKE